MVPVDLQPIIGYHKAAGCPVPSQIGAVSAQEDALQLCRSISKVQRLSTPLKISLSAEVMQCMPQRGKGPIETTRESVINKLRNVIVTRLVSEAFTWSARSRSN